MKFLLLKPVHEYQTLITEFEKEKSKSLLETSCEKIDCHSIETVPALFGNIVLIIGKEFHSKKERQRNFTASIISKSLIKGNTIIRQIDLVNGKKDIVGFNDEDLALLKPIIDNCKNWEILNKYYP